MDKDRIFLIQLVIIMAKFHIHEKKWTASKMKLKFECFYHELLEYDTVFKFVKNKRAMKTLFFIWYVHIVCI